MFVFCQLLAVFILVGISHTDAAPTSLWEDVAENNVYQQSELIKILKDAIFNSTNNNFYTIKNTFQP